jgi:guanyl-specific ribonuclease Sa
VPILRDIKNSNPSRFKDDGVRLGEREKVKPLLSKTFEETLYKIFKPKNESTLTNGSTEAPGSDPRVLGE